RHTRSKRDWSSDVCSSDLCCASCIAQLNRPSQTTLPFPDGFRSGNYPAPELTVGCCNQTTALRRFLLSGLLDPARGQSLESSSVDRKSTRLNSSHVSISYA